MRKSVNPLLWIILMPLVLIGGCFFQLQYKWWQFDHLEHRANRVITAAELQAWATNVLAGFPTYSASQHYQLRTNYPAKLRSVSRLIGGPYVYVHEDTSDSTNHATYYPAYVVLSWSIKPSGDAAFEIGPTNFVSVHPQAHAWAPGVYFYRR